MTYHLSSGDVAVNTPVSAVPYALEVSPSAIPAQVQANWAETSTTDAAYIQNKPDLATVATTGSYNDLSDKPAAPNNATITIAKNNTAVDNGTFTVDQSTNQTINIAVPTTVAELSDEADYAKVAADNSFTGTNTVPSLEETINIMADYILLGLVLSIYRYQDIRVEKEPVTTLLA